MKLIREHDEFDWIRDTLPISYEYLKGKALEFEPPIKDQNTLIAILNFLSNLGFIYGSWASTMDWDNEGILGLYINPSGRIIWTGDYVSEDYQNHINDYVEGYYAEGYVEVLDGWATLNPYISANKLNEASDEFDWIREIPTTIDPKHPPKKGDVLICLPGFISSLVSVNDEMDSEDAGSGYAEGRILVVSYTTKGYENIPGKELIIWPDKEESKKYGSEPSNCFDCGIYNHALAYYKEPIKESSDEFDWIRDVPLNVSFESVVIGREYNMEPTEVLFEAIGACGMAGNIKPQYSKKVSVINRSISPYNSTFCGHDKTDEVIILHLNFFMEWPNGEITEDTFWVTEDMVTLYEIIDEPLNESSDDFKWIEDIPTGIELETNTFYYFNPPLKSNEIPGFVDRITNSNKIKKLLMGANERGDNVTYFVTNNLDPNEIMKGWCTETPPYEGMKMYPSANKVDARKQFYLLNESTENPLQWIIDEPIGITLQPNTLYYFKPHLTLDEIKVFANGINNSEYIKNFLLRTVLDKVYQKGPNGGLKYFATGDNVNDRVMGWCTGTPVELSVHLYADLNQVDARKEFGL